MSHTTPDPHADPHAVAAEVLRRLLAAEWVKSERGPAEGRAWREEAAADVAALLRRFGLLTGRTVPLPVERLTLAMASRAVAAYAALGRLLDVDPREVLDLAEQYAADDPDAA